MPKFVKTVVEVTIIHEAGYEPTGAEPGLAAAFEGSAIKAVGRRRMLRRELADEEVAREVAEVADK